MRLAARARDAFDRAGTLISAAPRRYPRHVGLAALCVGLALAGTSAIVVTATGGVLAAVLSRLRHGGLALAAALLLVAGAAIGAARLEAIDRSAAIPPGSLAPTPADLLEHPRPSPFGSSAALRLVSGPARGARVLARAPADAAWPAGGAIGTRVLVAGGLRAPVRRAGSDIDWPAYLRRRGIAMELSISSLRSTGERRGGVAGALDGARARAERALGSGLPPARAALARGMVLGQDERIEPLVKDDFRRSGLAHILAVSGQNVMLLGALALPLLIALGFGPRGRIAGVLVLIALYVPLAGAGPSLQRAGVMGAAALVALAAGRPASRWYGLLLAAAVTLAANPRVGEDPGWQLSFAAVVGILLLAPALRRPLEGLPRPLAEGVAVTIAATLATAPLLGHHFGSVSLSGLPANVLALPAVAPVMWVGMVQAAVAQLTSVPGLERPLAEVLDLLGSLNYLLLGYIEWLARHFAQAPGARVELPLSSRGAVALAFALIGLAAVGVRYVARRLEPRATSTAAEWRRLPAARRLVLGGITAAAVVLAWMKVTGPGSAPEALTVSFLDVGQGDATLIQAPGGTAVLFDGGLPEARVAAQLKRAGVRRLSLVVATHQSRDHHGGLQEVVERYPVDTLLENGDGTRDRSFRRMVETARSRGAHVIEPRPGKALAVGALRIRVYGPPPRPRASPPPEDPNRRAIPAVVSYGDFDLFLSADAESDALAQYPDLPDVDAMKVSHHGSADPGLPQLLQRLRPQVAAIEVGKGNSYGHPTPATLAALDKAVPSVYRTDRDGTVRLTVEGARMRVDTER